MSDQQYTTCYFNASHRILATRYPIHLLKCLEQYNKDTSNKVKMKICVMNNTHVVPDYLFAAHVATCAGVKTVNSIYITDKPIKDEPVPAPSPLVLAQNQDDAALWEDDQPAYEPAANLNNRAILVSSFGSKAEKKRQRLLQRQKYRELENVQESLLAQSNRTYEADLFGRSTADSGIIPEEFKDNNKNDEEADVKIEKSEKTSYASYNNYFDVNNPNPFDSGPSASYEDYESRNAPTPVVVDPFAEVKPKVTKDEKSQFDADDFPSLGGRSRNRASSQASASMSNASWAGIAARGRGRGRYNNN